MDLDSIINELVGKKVFAVQISFNFTESALLGELAIDNKF